MLIDRVAALTGAIAFLACACVATVSGCKGGAGSLDTADGTVGPGESDPDGGGSVSSSSGSPEDFGAEGTGGQGDGGYSNFGPCGLDGGVSCFESHGSGPGGAVSMGCKTADSCAGESFACGHPAHCDGQLCCADTSNGGIRATCKADCAGADEVRLCETDADCGEGGACTNYACPQWVVARLKACTKPAGCN